jgi:beta-carotene ketolase (CrtW type)
LSWSAWILLSWLLTVAVLLALPMSSLPWWLLVAAILLRTHLQTGLFILGHDAMHGVLWQGHPVWNHRLGRLALALYAALPYGRCRANHQRHHQHAGTAFDPDVPSGEEVSILGWYQRFMGHYLSRQQMSCLLLGWSALLLAGVNWLNVLVICTVPLLLSSVQLFVVGTYLPHKRQQQSRGETQPASLALPAWMSFLACYHFGYHREHHEHPSLRWFELPQAWQESQTLAISG